MRTRRKETRSSETFTQIVSLCTVLLGAIISGWMIPYIKSKISAQELTKLTGYIAMGVRAAEQLFEGNQSQEKKAYVLKYIKSIIADKLKIELSDEQLDTIIEGTVNEVKKGLNQ